MIDFYQVCFVLAAVAAFGLEFSKPTQTKIQVGLTDGSLPRRRNR